MLSKKKIVDVHPDPLVIGNDVTVHVETSKLASSLGLDRIKHLLMFFGDGSWWNIKFLRGKESQRIGVIDNFGGSKLKLRFRASDSEGNYRFSNVYSYEVQGSEHAFLFEKPKTEEAFETGAGVNWIPDIGPNALEINLRTLKELKELGVRDIQINFFISHYTQLAMFEEILGFCDKNDVNIYFLFREVEPLPFDDRYLDDLGLVSHEEVIRYSPILVTKGLGLICQGVLSGVINLDSFWLPHHDSRDITKVKAYAYDPRKENPFESMIDITTKISWKILSQINLDALLEWIFDGDKKRIRFAKRLIKILIEKESVELKLLTEQLGISRDETVKLIAFMGRLVDLTDGSVRLAVPRRLIVTPRKVHPARGLLVFKGANLEKYNGWAFTILFWVRTARLWTLGPVWNDDYYEKVYKKVLIGKVNDAAKLGLHPSVKAISIINEPTLTWKGGELIDKNTLRLWTTFIKKHFRDDLSNLNRIFETDYKSFDEVPYVPRTVYHGACHKAWSGTAEKSLNSEYEYVKTLFKYWLMSLCYDRMAHAVKEAFHKPVFIKYNHIEPDVLAERASGGHRSSHLPFIDILGIDIYPLGHPYVPPKDPLEALSLFMYEAANIVLLGAANKKPIWLTEYACGKSRSYSEETAKMTELVNLAFFGMGIPQTHYWAVSSFGDERDSEEPYCPRAKNYKDRVLPTIETMGRLTRENRKRKTKLQDIEILLTYPEKDAFLWHATEDQFVTHLLQPIGTKLIELGYTVAHGVLTKEACEKAKMIVIYDGYYISKADKELLKKVNKPLVILWRCFPTDPLIGACEKVGNGPDPYVLPLEGTCKLGGREFNFEKAVAVVSPPEAENYDARTYGGVNYHPIFSVDKTLIFGCKLEENQQYAEVVDWWYQECHGQDDPPQILRVNKKIRDKKCELTIIATDDDEIESVDITPEGEKENRKVKAEKIGPVTYHVEIDYEKGIKWIIEVTDSIGQKTIRPVE